MNLASAQTIWDEIRARLHGFDDRVDEMERSVGDSATVRDWYVAPVLGGKHVALMVKYVLRGDSRDATVILQ